MALKNTGRFNVKWKVQGHHLRKSHPDQHYGVKSYKFLRQMAVDLRDVCLLIFQDDKKKVAVGEPGLPLAGASRTRRVFDSEKNSCADHDFHKFNITPFVTMFSSIPDDVDGCWTDGTVYVHLKDSIFEPSSPWRHLCEELYVLRDLDFLRPQIDGWLMDMPASQRMYEPASVILKYHDGGSDHNVSHAQVQLACITEFRITGVDFLVSMRCVPGQSWTNPAERIMSSVNF